MKTFAFMIGIFIALSHTVARADECANLIPEGHIGIIVTDLEAPHPLVSMEGEAGLLLINTFYVGISGIIPDMEEQTDVRFQHVRFELRLYPIITTWIRTDTTDIVVMTYHWGKK